MSFTRVIELLKQHERDQYERDLNDIINDIISVLDADQRAIIKERMAQRKERVDLKQTTPRQNCAACGSKLGPDRYHGAQFIGSGEGDDYIPDVRYYCRSTACTEEMSYDACFECSWAE